MTMLEKSVSDLKDSVLNMTLKVGTDLGNLDQFVIGVNATIDQLRKEMVAIGAGAGQGIDGVVSNKVNEAKAKIEAGIPDKITPEIASLKTALKADAQAYVDALRNGKLFTPEIIEPGESLYALGVDSDPNSIVAKVDKLIVSSGRDTPLLDVEISMTLVAGANTFPIAGPMLATPYFGFNCQYRTTIPDLAYEGIQIFRGILRGTIAGRVTWRPSTGGSAKVIDPLPGSPFEMDFVTEYSPQSNPTTSDLASITVELPVAKAREMLAQIKQSLPAEAKATNAYWQFEVSKVKFKGKVVKTDIQG